MHSLCFPCVKKRTNAPPEAMKDAVRPQKAALPGVSRAKKHFFTAYFLQNCDRHFSIPERKTSRPREQFTA